ncbi:hypothetical protein [Azonexus fungiphilus]|uniref:hypothetical protein n=1 Tax=Azonexus fungiphilus TaxID=146940 RepID=UPI00156AA01C|nr:hypothetical protein [Azonexus fungiphilus]NHC05927.1 hypothetical protein [Azonexus fungiphilus]
MSLRTKLLADLLETVFGFVRETPTSKVVRAEQSLTGGIEIIGPSGGPITQEDLGWVEPPLDQREILANTAGVYQQTGVARAVGDSFLRKIPGNIFYVSSEATNGFVVGNDSNSGLSKAAAKLTLNGAFTAAAAGDTIIINDSATPYDGTLSNLTKSITILPWTARGVTLRTNGSYTFRISAPNITFGAVIIDTNGVGSSAIRSLSGDVNGLRLIGTKLKCHGGYSLNHVGTCELLGGFEVESTGSTKAEVYLPTAAAGRVYIGPGANIDAHVTCSPTVAGVHFTVSGARIRSAPAVDGTSLWAVQSLGGCTSILIEDSDIGVDKSLQGIGILVRPHATISLTSCIIRRNRVSNGVAAANQISGYGIGIGAEATTAGTISGVEIYGNDISHANHGLFVGHKASGWTRGNVVRDTIIAVLTKGAVDVIQSCNVVVGGPLTGGALRSKESIGAKFYNNLVVWSSASASAGTFQQSDFNSIGTEFKNNILYAPSLAIPKAVLITEGTDAVFSHNDYFAGSFSTGAFAYGAATYNTVTAWATARESSALAVDPAFVGAGDYRLGQVSPLINAGVNVGLIRDFYDYDIRSMIVGPMQAVF